MTIDQRHLYHWRYCNFAVLIQRIDKRSVDILIRDHDCCHCGGSCVISIVWNGIVDIFCSKFVRYGMYSNFLTWQFSWVHVHSKRVSLFLMPNLTRSFGYSELQNGTWFRLILLHGPASKAQFRRDIRSLLNVLSAKYPRNRLVDWSVICWLAESGRATSIAWIAGHSPNLDNYWVPYRLISFHTTV